MLNTINGPRPPSTDTVAQTLEHVRALDLHAFLVEGRLSMGAELA